MSFSFSAFLKRQMVTNYIKYTLSSNGPTTRYAGGSFHQLRIRAHALCFSWFSCSPPGCTPDNRAASASFGKILPNSRSSSMSNSSRPMSSRSRLSTRSSSWRGSTTRKWMSTGTCTVKGFCFWTFLYFHACASFWSPKSKMDECSTTAKSAGLPDSLIGQGF